MLYRSEKRQGVAEQLRVRLGSHPDGIAHLQGDDEHPDLRGTVFLYQTPQGVIVVVDAVGLPSENGQAAPLIFGFHIHEGVSCTGNEQDPFADTGSHYNPKKLPHPFHAGDLPPLFGNHGKAFMAVLTDRFSVGEVIGRTVILHCMPDDFHTQPSGNAGNKIACGEIRTARV